MNLRLSVPGVSEVIGAFVWGYGLEDRSESVADCVGFSGSGLSEPVLELREELLDGVQVGRVFGQEEEAGARRPDGAPHGFALVRAEIVHDDDVALPQGRDEDRVDVEAERLAVDGPVEEPWRLDPVVAQGGEERHRPPVAVRHLGGQALAAPRPAAERGHVGFGPGLVDEDEAGRIDKPLPRRPLGASPRHVGAVLFGRDQRLFLWLSFSAWTNSQTER